MGYGVSRLGRGRFGRLRQHDPLCIVAGIGPLVACVSDSDSRSPSYSPSIR